MSTIHSGALQAFRAVALQGTRLTDELKLQDPNNGISSFEFFRQDDSGQISPALVTRYDPKVQDPAPIASYFNVDTNTRAQLRQDPAAFAALLDRTFAQHRQHLFPAPADLPNCTRKAQFNFIVGGRITQMVQQANELARSLYAGASLDRALSAVDDLDRKLMDRTVDFDEGGDLRMTTYGPYDETQVNFFMAQVEKFKAVDRRLLTPEQATAVDRAQRQAQNKVDILMRDQWVKDTHGFNSADGEARKGAILIDRQTRQRISVVKGTETSLQPRYTIMNVRDASGADRAVFWDHQQNKYFFDGGQQEVPANLIPQIVMRSLAEGAEQGYDITARPPQRGEHLRRDFPFDQTREGEISRRVIDWLGWAGLCHNQAMSESNGAVVPHSHPGHSEYVAAADRLTHYSPDVLNEPMLVIPDLGTVMARGGQRTDVGDASYGGFRNNEEPGKLIIDRLQLPRDTRRRNALLFSEVIKPDGTKVSSAEYFRERFAVPKPGTNGGYSSEANPNYVRTVHGDSVEARLNGCILKASVELERYGADGYLERERGELVLDFKNRPDTEVKVESFRISANPRQFAERTLNLAKGTLTTETFQLDPDPAGGGRFVKRSLGRQTDRINTDNPSGIREGNLDAPGSYLPLIEDAMRTGEPVVFESASDYQIWNSRLDSATRATGHADATHVTTRFTFGSKFGNGSATLVYDRTRGGGRTNHTGIDQRGDFWWRSHHRFVATQNGLVNEGAQDQGLIDVVGGVVRADMLNDMAEILYAAFQGSPYSIVHDGVRYLYADKATWEADVNALKAERAKVVSGGEPSGAVIPSVAVEPSRAANLLSWWRRLFARGE